ncbi:B3 domain-containing protein REM19 [Linum grandiflorum]
MVEQTQTPSSTLNFADELDCESFFDEMDDLLDFPSDDDAETMNYEDVNNSLKPTSSILANHGDGGSDDRSAELYVPYNDIVQLELLSSVVEDSVLLTMNKEDLSTSVASPISVHDSSRDHQKAAASGKRGRPLCKKVCPCCYTYFPLYSRPQMQRYSNPEEPGKTTTNSPPSFRVTITKTYIALGQAYIPVSFAERYMMKETEMVGVKVGNGDEVWEMKVNRWGKNKNSVRMTSGWIQFVRDNHLQVGNVCIFNLLRAHLRRPLFHVTILRNLDIFS